MHHVNNISQDFYAIIQQFEERPQVSATDILAIQGFDIDLDCLATAVGAFKYPETNSRNGNKEELLL